MDIHSVNLAPYIIYYATLLACIPLATCYKSIEDVEKKRNFGVCLGLFTTLAVCGPNVIYTFLLVAGNIVIIKSCNKTSVHHISLSFTWLLLIYLNFFVDCSKYTLWLFQMLSLRLVGLAFEIYMHGNAALHDKKNLIPDEITELSALDIVSYAYFFVGLHKGPYYSWRCYNDHLNSLMSLRGNFRAVTEQKMKKAIAFSLLYLLIWLKYPHTMYEHKDFYQNYGTDYRFISTFPHLMMYFLESQIILMISTSASTEAGFGVYPKKCLAVPGGGPTVPCKLTGEDSLKDEYNFAMLKCFDNEKLLLGPKMKDTVRGWDLSIRYWFNTYIVKNFVQSNFEVRSAFSFLFWTIWIGPNVQNVIKSLTLWVYIHLESEYAGLSSDTLQGPWDLGFAIMRLLCLFYLTPCYVIDDSAIAIKYYNSIYWVYHIVLLVLTVVAIFLQTQARGVSLTHSVFSRPDSLQVTGVADGAKKSVLFPVAPGGQSGSRSIPEDDATGTPARSPTSSTATVDQDGRPIRSADSDNTNSETNKNDQNKNNPK